MYLSFQQLLPHACKVSAAELFHASTPDDINPPAFRICRQRLAISYLSNLIVNESAYQLQLLAAVEHLQGFRVEPASFAMLSPCRAKALHNTNELLAAVCQVAPIPKSHLR